MTAFRRSLCALAILGLSLANSAARAQTTTDSIGPRAGSWAAEANYGGGDGASLLYFSSSHAAWVLRANFNVGSETQDEPQFGVGGTTTTSTTSTVGGVSLQVGGRWWSGEPSARLRPFTGLGVIGQYSTETNNRANSVGAYGELGATYFFSPHVSLGAAGELDLTSTHARFGSDDTTVLKTSAWRFSGNLVRFMATVYF